jgi:uncharacterized protein (TIGR00369 family)
LNSANQSDLEARLRRSPLFRLLELELVDIGHGTASVALAAGAAHVNLDGFVHGGAIAVLADMALGAAIRSRLDPGWRNRTLTFTVDYLGAAASGDRLLAEARVSAGGRRHLWAEASIRHGEEIIATARSLSAVSPPA